ncbi:expressed unknown protein [Seminavis robusta]|uniref:Uncharacterized protein n=1 Tax=Seminavis robusta TaxID=568900 RepID=A0A9N8E5U7_9STRA|nr:expressed unknown protein [Seminavis robusta]|eukprot:Sro693_g188310.1 n/a (236) ;mRNA; r:28895-29602
MGGAASHFSDTDWEKADGGLKEASETFDGTKPTEGHALFYLTKEKSLVNQRDCELRDEDNTLLYTTCAVEGTTKDFDLTDSQKQKILHVHTNSLRSKWEIYSYKATFEGQTPATEAKVVVKEPLYHKATVTITYDKYHGVIRLTEAAPENTAGILSHDAVLKIEEIKSITAQFQSCVPKLGLMHPKLCGYWVREHTAKTDRIKVHLAKGSDVCLHSILVVITNLLHVERQAEKCQ